MNLTKIQSFGKPMSHIWAGGNAYDDVALVTAKLNYFDEMAFDADSKHCPAFRYASATNLIEQVDLIHVDRYIWIDVCVLSYSFFKLYELLFIRILIALG